MPKHARRLGLAFRLSLLLERLRGPRLLPRPPTALVRAYAEVRVPVGLEGSYYPARQVEGYALIPWDRYMQEAEEALVEATRSP
ncbi:MULTISPECIES: hypothetical protein [Thermus]|uniref:Uncharacterized protein n=1 Tax=Thermus brockianus TaxID=56956 RepID=A0A1J0LSD4_THEBO|nr:hypothetical protein [Thermus brockianus]APD08383.1 hypothetical protein A0O31_00156 [Thermus brockianus]